MPTLKTFIPIEPQPQGSKNAYNRGGRIVLVESSANLKQNRTAVSLLIHKAAYEDKFVRAEKDTPVVVSAIMWLKRPKTVTRQHHTVKPDTDKLGRFVLDAISDAGNVWVDDSQVVTLHLQKHYGNKVGIDLVVDYV